MTKGLKNIWITRDPVPRTLLSSAKLRNMFLIWKAKVLWSEKQTTCQQKKPVPWHWQGGSRDAAHHIHHCFPCSLAKKTDKRHVFHTYAKREETDSGQGCSLRFEVVEVSKIWSEGLPQNGWWILMEKKDLFKDLFVIAKFLLSGGALEMQSISCTCIAHKWFWSEH